MAKSRTRQQSVTNASSPQYEQLKLLDTVFDEREKSSDEFVEFDLDRADIGGNLIALLSRGLYTNPLHAIREYVQNSVDANTSQIKIRIIANNVTIYDDGDGMDANGVVQARRFGVSTKDTAYQVGFRGVGIYSGYDLCNRLVITSKKAGELYRYVLQFQFGEMRRALERRDGTQPHLPLQDLIQKFSGYNREPDERSKHYTQVILEDVTPAHLHVLADRERLKNYILQNLPIDFDEKFPYRDEINERLRQEVPGFKAVRVLLEVAGAPPELIVKPTIAELAPPIMEPIFNAKQEKIGFYWACMRQPADLNTRGKISEQKGKEHRGFVYKMKGFTIGNNQKLRQHFRLGQGTLYDWYTGEIYVIDTSIIPNAERNDFEANSAKDILEKSVVEALHKLEREASRYQTITRARQVFDKGDSELRELELKIDNEDYVRREIYLQISNIIDDMEKQQSKLDKGYTEWGGNILKRAKQRKEKIAKEIDNPPPITKRQKDVVKRRNLNGEAPLLESQLPTMPFIQSSIGEQIASQPQLITDFPPPAEAPPEEERESTLIGVLETEGWSMTEEAIVLLKNIDEVLVGVLNIELYQRVLEEMASRFANEIAQ